MEKSVSQLTIVIIFTYSEDVDKERVELMSYDNVNDIVDNFRFTSFKISRQFRDVNENEFWIQFHYCITNVIENILDVGAHILILQTV